jgi:hypothetical protein
MKKERILIFMKLLKLTGKKICSLRPGLLPSIMFIFLTIRTVLSGNAVMFSGLCIAFLPFFMQLRNHTQPEAGISNMQDIISSYLMNFFLLILGMSYLKVLTWLGSTFYVGYTSSPILHELFLLTFLCDVVFISIVTPLTCTSPKSQSMMIAILLANVEIGFMLFANKLLRLAGASFTLDQQWGYFLLAVLLPVMSLSCTIMSNRKKTFSTKKAITH